jgi:DNA-binding Lrp family transcriptional regulator
MNISRDEWLAALGDAAAPCDPDALTTVEIAEQFGISTTIALRRVQALVSEGKAKRTHKIVGARRTPAYKLVKNAPRPATRKR